MNRHPTQEEADEVRASYKEKHCSYGDDCQTEGCLYWHPWEAAVETTEYTGELCSAVDGLHLQMGSPTFEEWLELNCPAPPTMDEHHVYSLWHYPGSGMQRSPWDVYCLMYPQQSIGAPTLHATSQIWEPEANNMAPQSWEPVDNNANQQQNEDPKTFQEWKKKGQPYPSWFCFDLDPWYDDDGVRRGLEEVYDILYGENAESNFSRKQQAQNVANDPTPAELAAMLNADESQPTTISPSVTEPTSSGGGGWASIAAKPPAPVRKMSVSDTKFTSTTSAAGISDNHNNNNTATSLGNGSSNNSNKRQMHNMVPIPKEVWLPSTANSDCFHLYPNAIERFKAVNSHHASYLASVSIPLSFDSSSNNNKNNSTHNNNNKAKRAGKVALLDVHFQSAKTITPVLNRFLIPAIKKNDEVWIVTGSGHHVAVGHQRREGGGVLFNAVKRYLEDHEEEMEWEFRIGKDCSGGKNKISGGAILVRKIITT
jgi:hypothetical protein